MSRFLSPPRNGDANLALCPRQATGYAIWQMYRAQPARSVIIAIHADFGGYAIAVGMGCSDLISSDRVVAARIVDGQDPMPAVRRRERRSCGQHARGY
jgi:hypothetical protein